MKRSHDGKPPLKTESLCNTYKFICYILDFKDILDIEKRYIERKFATFSKEPAL